MHLADLHLGFEQYHVPQRAMDFQRTFQRAVDDALREDVDFVIIAGDLFHQRTLQPRTLQLAERELERLRTAGKPVIAVVGNHERPMQNSRECWLDYLAGRGLVRLLSPRYSREGELVISPWEPASGKGATVDVGPARLYGIAFYGATLPRMVGDLAGYLAQQGQRPEFAILVMHAGLEGVLPNFSANVTSTDLAALRPHIQYLAMGHVHKPFESDGWIYNPGSLEPVNIAETAYRGGGYLVDVDTAREPAIRAEHRAYWTRPFLRLSLAATGYATPEALHAGVKRHLAGQAETRRRDEAAGDQQPMVEYTLHGVLQFPRDALDARQLEETVREALNPLHVRINITATPPDYEVAGGEAEMSRPELERRVLRDIIAQDGRYRGAAEALADLALEAKRMTLDKADPAAIIEHLRAGRRRIIQTEQGHDANHAG
jgi:predicted phosphodiesterase